MKTISVDARDYYYILGLVKALEFLHPDDYGEGGIIQSIKKCLNRQMVAELEEHPTSRDNYGEEEVKFGFLENFHG